MLKPKRTRLFRLFPLFCLLFCAVVILGSSLAFARVKAISSADAIDELVFKDIYIIGDAEVSEDVPIQYRAIALYRKSDGTIYAFDVTDGGRSAYPLVMGDANLDGTVDIVDLGMLSGNYGKQIDLSDPNSHPWRAGDFNLDGKVDLLDLSILSSNYAN